MKSRSRTQQDALSEEMQSHLEELVEELIAAGYTPDDARYEARKRFGNQTGLLETSREIWRVKWLDSLYRDFRFTWRLARRQPWTMIAAIVSIAIGVGADTAITSVVDTVLLNPLGLKNSNRLIAATVHIKKLQMTGAETSGAEFRDLQSCRDVLTSITATEGRAWTLGGEQPVRLLGVAVTPEFFNVFNINPQLGTLSQGLNDDTVVLSDALWKTRFGQSASVIGQKLLLDGKLYQVIGVAPSDFHFPAKAEAWVPLILTPDRFTRGNNMSLSLYGRIRDDVSITRVQQRVDGQLLHSNDTLGELGYGIDVEPIAKRIAGDLRLPILFLWIAASILLLAACANVAGLLMARAASRRNEIAIRIAIGGSKWQILGQLLTESIILASIGGAAGIMLASTLLDMLRNQPLAYQNVLRLATLNGRLLLYGLALSLFSSLLFGVIPALELLRNQHVGSLLRARRKWFQNIYIVGQVSAAMLLLVMMGLLLKSLNAIGQLGPGFNSDQLTTAFLIKPAQNQIAFYEELLSNLRKTPGIQSAALAYTLPFAGGEAPTSMFDIKSHHHQPGQPEWHGEAYQVSPDYFSTLRIPLLRGRLIQESDTAAAPRVVIIDEGLAKRFFANEDPLGQEIAMYSGWARVVGVVAAVKDETVEQSSRPVVYYALKQIPFFPQIGVVVRSSVPAAGIIRDAVAAANPKVPIFDVKTMRERIDASQSTRTVMAVLVSLFAGITALLAAIGVHGVIAQIVAERTPEIGIRMALGARSADIFQRYAMQGLRLSIVGVGLGLCAAVAFAGLLRNLLYKVQPLDPVVMICGGIGVLLISTIAVFAPAWRASHVDPQIALRSE